LIDLLAEKARSIDGPVSVLLSARALNVDNNVGVRLARTLTAALSRLNEKSIQPKSIIFQIGLLDRGSSTCEEQEALVGVELILREATLRP
jgi:hypothetical protein